MKAISVQKIGNNVVGLPGYTQVADPSIQSLPSNLQSLSGMFAVQGPDGKLLLQNPVPGTLGNMSPTNLRGLGNFALNGQLSKSFSVAERFRFELRAVVQNLLNKPIWSNPTLNMNSTSFGLITSASGSRQVGLSARVEF